MPLSISIHGCVKVRAVLGGTVKSTWVDIYFVDSYGDTTSICVFFNERADANKLIRAINEEFAT